MDEVTSIHVHQRLNGMKSSGRRVSGAIRSVVNARDLQLECASLLYETLLVPLFMYGSDTVLWREKEISRIRAVQVDNLR